MSSITTASFPFMRFALFLVLLSGVYVVLKPFFAALAWTGVIAVTLWPINRFLRSKIRWRSEPLAASCMTLLLVVVFLGVVIPLSLKLASDISRFVDMMRESTANGEIRLPDAISQISWLNDYLQPLAAESAKARLETFRLLEEYQPQMISAISFAARGIWGILFQLGIILFSSYFVFRYGDVVGKQLTSLARLIGGSGYVERIDTTWVTIQAVAHGVAGAAIAQGIIAGIGFYLSGAPIPFLLGVATTVLGLIPFGPPFIYLPVAVFLLINGSAWYYGVGLAIWGVAVVSTIDNFFRPLIISQTSRLSILLAFFGGIGGISAFGMVGIFIGPVLLALAQTFWLDLAKVRPEPDLALKKLQNDR